MTQRDPSSASGVPSRGERCSVAVGRDAAFPDCHSEPPAPPPQGLGNIKAGPAGALYPDVSSQQVLVSAWLGQTLDVTKGRENSHWAFSKPPAPALSHRRRLA